MSRTLTDVAYDLGVRLRRARLRRGFTQVEVEERCGVSTSTQSRMELGRGGRVPLDSWVAAASLVGADLFTDATDDTDVYLAAVRRLVAEGGWALSQRRRGYVWFDRPGRPWVIVNRVYLPAERIVIRIVLLVTDLEAEQERLRRALGVARRHTPPGQRVQGALVVLRTGENRRRVPDPWRRSTPGWVSATRSATSVVPARPGLLWLAPGGSHWLPAA